MLKRCEVELDERDRFRLQGYEEEVRRLQQIICELLLINERLRCGMTQSIAGAGQPHLETATGASAVRQIKESPQIDPP
jgi:hypothetical protein